MRHGSVRVLLQAGRHPEENTSLQLNACRLAAFTLSILLSLALPGVAPTAREPSTPEATDPAWEEFSKQLKHSWDLGEAVNQLRRDDKYAEALAKKQEQLAFNRQLWQHQEYLLVEDYEQLADLYVLSGEFGKAREARRENLRILTARWGPDHWRCLDARVALEGVDRLERLGTKGCDVLETLRELEAMVADFSAWQESYAVALAVAERGVVTRQKLLGEDDITYARSLFTQGNLLWSIGNDAARAEPQLAKAAEITRRLLGNDHPEYALRLRSLMSLNYGTGRLDESQRYARQALAISKRWQAESPWTYAGDLCNLSTIDLARGDYENAEVLLGEARAILQAWSWFGRYQLPPVLGNLGFLYLHQQRYAEAEAVYREAAEMAQKEPGGPWSRAYLSGLEGLARTYEVTGRRTEAITTLGQILEAQQQHVRSTFGAFAEPTMRDCLLRTRPALDMLLRLVAQDPADPAQVELALNWVWKRKSMILDVLCQFRDAQAQLARRPAVAERATRLRELQDQQNRLLLQPELAPDLAQMRPALAAIDEQIRELKEALSRNLVLSGALAESEETDVATIRRKLSEKDALVDIVRCEPYRWGQESMKGTARYFAFVVPGRSQEPIAFIDLGEASTLESLLSELRSCTQIRGTEILFSTEAMLESEYKAIAQRVTARVFAPLKVALGDAQRIFVAADGELNRIALESLVDDNGAYLVEKYAFCYLSNARDLTASTDRSGRGVIVFADPNFDLPGAERAARFGAITAERTRPPGEPAPVATPAAAASLPLSFQERRSPDARGLGWKRLPGTASEAQRLNDELKDSIYAPVTIYSGNDALEDVLRLVSAPRVLVIASHAFFLPDQKPAGPADGLAPSAELQRGAAWGLERLRGTENPLLRCGLVLAGANRLSAADIADRVGDGWVTAEEVSLLDLRGTELVILSACQSGLGELRCGEGVSGLRRAFTYAGAETLVMSLYEVPDTETQQLMASFYEHLKTGSGKLAALRNAQLSMIARRRQELGAAHPYYWGSFVLVGAPD